jgi:cytochrome oxidase Cu insertion factor (SCO1/SenC/PrrC family)
MNRRAVLLGAGSFMLALTVGSVAEAEISYGGTFILVDQKGSPITDENFRGKYMLIAFGYTHCPDICPTLLADMANAMTRLGPEGAEITPIFVTLDPARDTPKVIADYVSSFSPRMVGLTGPEEYIASAAQKYHIKYEKHPEKNGNYSIDHTAAIFLMGRDGQFLDRFDSGVKTNEMVERIRARLKAGNP